MASPDFLGRLSWNLGEECQRSVLKKERSCWDEVKLNLLPDVLRVKARLLDHLIEVEESDVPPLGWDMD